MFEVRSLSKSFFGVRALTDVSLTVDAGEIVGLIGPNGSGKSTLINVVSGVYPASSGSVTLHGSDLLRLRTHEFIRRGVTRSFQNLRLMHGLTVYENVVVPAVSSRRAGRGDGPSRAARDALRFVGLHAQGDRPVETLPFALQRRVELARAMATQPEIILLDEPAAGLNEVETDELMGTLEAVRDKTGTALLIIEHDMRLVAGVVDRVSVLVEGCSIMEGKPDDVLEDPRVVSVYLGSTG